MVTRFDRRRRKFFGHQRFCYKEKMRLEFWGKSRPFRTGSITNCVVIFGSITGEMEGKWEDDDRTSEKSREEPDRRSEAVILPTFPYDSQKKGSPDTDYPPHNSPWSHSLH
jgi:hypothetical protein